MNDYRLSDALDEIEACAYNLGKEHDTPHIDHLRGTLRQRISDIRAGVFEALSTLDQQRQMAAGITCPTLDENAVNFAVTIANRNVTNVSTGDDWL